MKWVLLAILTHGVVGCESVAQKQVFPIFIRVIDDEGVVVPASIVQLGGKRKRTNNSGIAQFIISGSEGENVQAQIECPDDWKALPSGQQDIVLRSLVSINGKQIQPAMTTFICVPLKKRHVVIVKTNGVENLSVQLLGKEVARTNKDGIAHFVVSGQANERIELVLNTDHYPLLTPQMPARQLTLPQQRRFLVFEQKFSKRVVERNRKKRNPRRRLFGPRRL